MKTPDADDTTRYSIKFTTATIERKDDYSYLPTYVELVDEGAGPFFEVYQEKRSEALRFDPEEIPLLVEVCQKLLNQS